MKYNILKFVRNAEDSYSATVSATFDDLEGAKVNYHQTLAALHNAKDVKTATVKIEDEFGRQLSGFIEIVNHEETNS
jgi:hypothetical protein